ncbi:phosphotransferase family protein [Roseivirga misakiensis]|uniref:Aminoglycoside phosphotransferase n=1 Tax=Roseivirga misakiensis TaxID=1563681 RepID=A0A1E5SXZ8_9BACT|nr:phosphotransferase family protein [Roseivirga misakiensis]OEK03999.1 aminoglycoside phosphotransferase [Roseivirga misakiensis]
MIDQPRDIREGEELDVVKLKEYLSNQIEGFNGAIEVSQFPSGFSNLTYLIKTEKEEYVLRRPPFGANIKSGHDMGREFKVLSLLKPNYANVPKPILFCEDESILGAEFYIMERVKGVILRGKPPKGIHLSEELMKSISEACIDNLAALHTMDLKEVGLSEFGKPDGYTDRQVEGWIKRYYKSETDKIAAMDEVANWMKSNMPVQNHISFLHNDYKYDNLVLNPEKLSEITAVLDWEMSTVGNPLMDLGTSLAYWAQADDADALKPFSLTWLPGNLNRSEFVDRYATQTGFDLTDKVFYYVFGAFKIGVIIQQIYARYKKGLTNDPRFAQLIYAVMACAENARKAIDRDKI